MARSEKVSYWRGNHATIPSNGISGRIMMEEDTGDCFLEFNWFNPETGAWEIKRKQLTDNRKFDIAGGLYTGPVVLAMQPEEAETIISETGLGWPIPQIAATKQYVDNVDDKLFMHAEDSSVHLGMHDENKTEREYWNNKVDSEEGKGLSTNDFTNIYRSKLDGISKDANKAEFELDETIAETDLANLVPLGTITITNSVKTPKDPIPGGEEYDPDNPEHYTLSENQINYVIYAPRVTDIEGNAETATTLKDARLIDGISFDGSKDVSHYGICNTSGTDSIKYVDIDDYIESDKSSIYVKFGNEDELIVVPEPKSSSEIFNEEYPDVQLLNSYFDFSYEDTSAGYMLTITLHDPEEYPDVEFSGLQHAFAIAESEDSSGISYIVFELPDGFWIEYPDPEDPEETISEFIEYGWNNLKDIAYSYSANDLKCRFDLSGEENVPSDTKTESLSHTLIVSENPAGYYGSGMLKSGTYFGQYEDSLPPNIHIEPGEPEWVRIEFLENSGVPEFYVRSAEIQSDPETWYLIDDYITSYFDSEHIPGEDYLGDQLTFKQVVNLTDAHYSLYSGQYNIEWMIRVKPTYDQSEFVYFSVNGKEQKPIIYEGSQLGRNKLKSNAYHFVYDDDQYILVGDLDPDYKIATQTTSGLLSSQDKQSLDSAILKLNSIEDGANNYVLPPATNLDLGGVSIGSNISVTEGGEISVTSSNIVSALGYTPTSGDIDVDVLIDQIGVFQGVSADDPTKEGSIGLVPSPNYMTEDYDRFLCGNGTWRKVNLGESITIDKIAEICGVDIPIDAKFDRAVDISMYFNDVSTYTQGYQTPSYHMLFNYLTPSLQLDAGEYYKVYVPDENNPGYAIFKLENDITFEARGSGDISEGLSSTDEYSYIDVNNINISNKSCEVVAVGPASEETVSGDYYEYTMSLYEKLKYKYPESYELPDGLELIEAIIRSENDPHYYDFKFSAADGTILDKSIYFYVETEIPSPNGSYVVFSLNENTILESIREIVLEYVLSSKTWWNEVIKNDGTTTSLSAIFDIIL